MNKWYESSWTLYGTYAYNSLSVFRIFCCYSVSHTMNSSSDVANELVSGRAPQSSHQHVYSCCGTQTMTTSFAPYISEPEMWIVWKLGVSPPKSIINHTYWYLLFISVVSLDLKENSSRFLDVSQCFHATSKSYITFALNVWGSCIRRYSKLGG